MADSLVHLIAATEWAVEQLYASARRVPAERLEWAPMDAGRTVLDQLQECANAPNIALAALDPTFEPPFHSMAAALRGQREWTTLEQCEEKTREVTARLVTVLRDLPEEKLGEMHTMPWGESLPAATVAGMHYWNLTYHLGQINYIQTLYGDTAMR